MPLLDVSEAFDELFMDSITVIRRVEAITLKGRSTTSESAQTIDAVVVPTSPDDLTRLEVGEYMNKSISIYSKNPFRLRGPSRNPATGEEYQPDEVLWHGSHYVVRVLEDYTGFGEGFVHAVAVSMDAVDPPPDPDIPDPIGRA